MTPAVLYLIGVAFAAGVPLTMLFRSLGRRWGQMDAPGGRKIHAAPTPATGGMAIYWAMVGPMVAGWLAVRWLGESFWQSKLPRLVEHLPGISRQTPMLAAFLVGLSLLHFTGVIDDRRNLGPRLKLAIQIAAAAVLAIFFDVRLLELMGPVLSVIVTALWFAAVINAFNFMDNMDGLSAGAAAICAAVFLAAALLHGQIFVAALLALLLGALLAFLLFNFPPASIFMGDGGSLIVGYTLAFCSVRLTYYEPTGEPHWWAVFTPLIVLAIPLYDLASVTLIRLAQGRNPFVGDTQHFSHRLVRKGLSRRTAVIVIWCCTLATSLGGVMIGRLAGWQAAVVVGQTLAVVATLALLERAGDRS